MSSSITKEIFTYSNGLSLMRAPLALLLFVNNPIVRLTAVLLAMLTDFIDGYVARRFYSTTRLGAILDPLMDKLFVLTALAIFFTEGRIYLWQGLAMISRDFYLCIFGLWLRFTSHWKEYRCRAIWWGKIITTLQFGVLIALSLNISLPSVLYPLFILLGLLAFIELFQVIRTRRS